MAIHIITRIFLPLWPSIFDLLSHSLQVNVPEPFLDYVPSLYDVRIPCHIILSLLSINKD